MTSPPTDRELKKLDDDAMIERSERGDDPLMSDVMAHRRRVLFTAGERLGIERARQLERYAPALAVLVGLRNTGSIRTEAKQLYEVLDAITSLRPNHKLLVQLEGQTREFLESLRDAPAVSSPLESVPADDGSNDVIGMLKYERPRRGKEHCAEALALLEDEPPAKPEAAGEEPAFLARWRMTLRETLPGIPVWLSVAPEELPELLAWLDRPAPVAKGAGERSFLNAWERQDFETLIRNEHALYRDAWERYEAVKEERDRLRARVAELELLHPPQPTE